MKKLALLLALVPALALAIEGGGSTPPAGAVAQARRPDPENAARLQKRMRLALTLGLAETLDLTDAQALKVGAQLDALVPRRQAAHQQVRDAMLVLRRSAEGDKLPAAEVDQAVTRLLDARAQLQAIDRELVTSVTRDQPPEKRARAVLFLARFHQSAMQRFGKGRGPMMGAGGAGRCGGRPGMGPGMGPGRGAGMGPGMGPGRAGEPLGMADEGGWDDDE